MTKHILKLPSPQKFTIRVTKNLIIALISIAIALCGGMVGYHIFEAPMAWSDAFLNAAMILSGMGPLGEIKSTGGRIFAGCYALFSGLFFIIMIGLISAPIAHLYFKKWHIEDEND